MIHKTAIIDKNAKISNNVKILDNCVVGKHGFGFFPNKVKNLRYPHTVSYTHLTLPTNREV